MNFSNKMKDRIFNKIQSYINNFILPKERLVSLNDQILLNLDSKKTFSAVRFGNTENIIFNKIHNHKSVESLLLNLIHYSAGFFPKNFEALKNEFYANYLNSLENIDYLGFAGRYGFSKKLIKSFNGKFFLDNSSLDPIYLINYYQPWTLNLKGKRVLVISSHKKSILYQSNKLEKIWGQYLNKACPFDLIGVVKAPHYGQDSITNEIKWIKIIDNIVEEVAKYKDIDIVLIGAGAYAPVISAKIKTYLKISSITTCGATQLFYGIKGGRWEKGSFPEHQKIFNDYWINPIKSDRPKNFEFFVKTEGNSTYW